MSRRRTSKYRQPSCLMYTRSKGSKTKGCATKCTKKYRNTCRMVVGKRETCCIRPNRGFWCWSKGIKKAISKKMKRECCRT